MRWVTWCGVHVDRMACGWLIKKYIDPDAVFVFVPPDQASLPEDATPFDVPGVKLSHHQGHSSFHALVRANHIQDKALRRMAQIVDEADVSQELCLEPAAPGLDLICTGIALSFQDDHKRLECAAVVFDALYAAIKDEGWRE